MNYKKFMLLYKIGFFKFNHIKNLKDMQEKQNLWSKDRSK